MEPFRLDVRPFFERGEEPFDAITAAVTSLDHDHDRELLLINSFEPTPLLAVMKQKGFLHTSTHVGPGEWRVLFKRIDDRKSD